MDPLALGLLSALSAVAASASAISDQRMQVFHTLSEKPIYTSEGPQVSVIVPCLQEEDWLPNLLTSIKNQTYSPIEVVIVDQSVGGYNEKLQTICLEYGAKCIHIDELNVAAARNRGAEVATSDMLIFSDADNIFTQDCVENLVLTLQQGYMLANPVLCVYDDGLYSVASLWRNNWFKSNVRTTCCIAVWKQAFNDVGGYDETWDPLRRCGEDLMFGRAIANRFGQASMKLVRQALVGTSARRRKAEGLIFTSWANRIIR